MPLSPHPRQDALIEAGARVSPRWDAWVNALRVFVTGHDTRIAALETQITALEARVTALEGP